MARIFVGNRAMVDEGVLEAVRALGDEFWVLAEFDVNRRNIDWLILRQVPDDRPAGRYSTVILTELKRTRAVLDGDDNSRWREYREGLWHELEPSNMRDMNPWRQLINTVNTFREWLYNNQRRFLAPNSGQVYPEAAVKIWPNLLILSDPAEIVHRLPLKPHNGFGAYHFHLGEWVRRAWGWTPREGLQLTAAEIEDLTRVLGVQELPRESAPRSLNGQAMVDVATEHAAIAGSLDWLDGFASWAAGIEQRMRELEARLEAMATAPAAVDRPQPMPVRPSALASPPGYQPDRALTEDERGLIVDALANLRDSGKNRDFPCLFAEMHRMIGGPTFKTRNFNGYGSALNMMTRAVVEGLVTFGPTDANGVPTVYLPEEEAPAEEPADAEPEMVADGA
ncbi:MAG: hypothetical protein ACRDJH_16150 [Thermomicrobiales bacterium]